MEFMTGSFVKWDPNVTCWITYVENKLSTSKLTFDTSLSYIIRLPSSLLRYIDQSWSTNRSVEIITHSFDEIKHFASRYYFRPDCLASDHTCNNVRPLVGNKHKIKTLGIRKFYTLCHIIAHFVCSFWPFRWQLIWLFQAERLQFEIFRFKILTNIMDFIEFYFNLENFLF